MICVVNVGVRGPCPEAEVAVWQAKTLFGAMCFLRLHERFAVRYMPQAASWE